MRLVAIALIATALVACSNHTATQQSPYPVSSAQSPAADLRVHLDLLLAEQVMLVAKETAAAVNHSDEYMPYTTLLGANTADLSAIIGRAFGSTTAAQFTQLWNMRNSYLVDYAIGIVTHDDAKASGATAGLDKVFSPQFGQLLVGMVDQPFTVGLPLHDEDRYDSAFINDLFAQKYAAFYEELHSAYARSRDAGDALSEQIATRFPDKFPGRADGRDVIQRVANNLLLQEHSYLATMATDAAVAKRGSEKTAAVSALATSASTLASAWLDWDGALLAYATGATVPSSNFIDSLTSATGATTPEVKFFVQAAIRVVDDQKAGSSRSVADDDRAAATATQPIADSIQG